MRPFVMRTHTLNYTSTLLSTNVSSFCGYILTLLSTNVTSFRLCTSILALFFSFKFIIAASSEFTTTFPHRSSHYHNPVSTTFPLLHATYLSTLSFSQALVTASVFLSRILPLLSATGLPHCHVFIHTSFLSNTAGCSFLLSTSLKLHRITLYHGTAAPATTHFLSSSLHPSRSSLLSSL